MATAEAGVGTIAPMQGANIIDRAGNKVSANANARLVYRAHRNALISRRSSMLIWEKLLLHVDGSGDFQWADILDNNRVEIPRLISEYRKTENLMRIVVENAVNHHVTMPLRFFDQGSPDRIGRERAMVNTIWANHLAYEQDFNGLFGEALWLAMCCGFCPVHAYWRDDVSSDFYEGVGLPEGLVPGMIDCWVGNPFDTVFDRAATRGSVRWSSYSRLVSADAVRKAFDHVPAARSLEGSTRVPSTANFQRIARSWQMSGLGLHGSPVIDYRRGGDDEELITLICREDAPGTLVDWPEGRLTIVAVPGSVDMYRGEGGESGFCVPLAEQPLPAGDFSWENFYSHTRGNDVHGKPWAEDIDPLQVDLNIALSKRWEAANRMLEAPIVAPGGAIGEDMVDMGGYNLLEIEPTLAAWRPAVMQWPEAVVRALDNEVAEKRRAIYTIGGYQSVSRGEAPGSRMAAQAIRQLQEADRSIHGGTNVRFRRSATSFMRKCWRQMKAYGDVPWLINIIGDEYAHLADQYIDNSKLSDQPPNYKLVNAFGVSPEGHADELIALAQIRCADGMPFLRSDEARRGHPNQAMFDHLDSSAAVRRRRAKTVAQAFVDRARDIRAAHTEQVGIAQQSGMQMPELGDVPSDPMVQRYALAVFQEMEATYKRLRDDDLFAHIAAYTEVIQDETADVIAREALILRQNLYYEWQALMAKQSAPAEDEEGAGDEKKPAEQAQ